MPNTELSPETAFLIDFNVQDVAIALGLPLSPASSASILGISEQDFVDYVKAASKEVVATATNLRVNHPAINNLVTRLSQFKRVMAIGDSITTYRYSYARLLEYLLKDTEFINRGYSGYTTTHGLELTYTQFLSQKPDYVFIKYGVNDCKIFGDAGAKTLVSLAEYRANISAMIEAFQRYAEAKIVLLSPTPVVEDIVVANPDFESLRMTWRNTDLQQRAEVLLDLSRKYQTEYVDLYHLFGDTPDAAFYLPDGLHPNPLGHRHILTKIAEVG